MTTSALKITSTRLLHSSTYPLLLTLPLTTNQLSLGSMLTLRRPIHRSLLDLVWPTQRHRLSSWAALVLGKALLQDHRTHGIRTFDLVSLPPL